MSISPWYPGQTNPSWTVTWPLTDLTGATVTVRVELSGGSGAAGTGTVTITSPTLGQVTYKPGASDFTAGPGTYYVQFKAVLVDGSIKYADPLTVQVPATV